MFDEETQLVTIIDFNVSVDLKQTNGVTSEPTGLKEWSAPETRSHPEYDQQCDMWSCGCLLYFIYKEGDNPFIMASPTAQNIEEALVDLGKMVDDFEKGPLLVDLIESLLRLDPAQRLTAA